MAIFGKNYDYFLGYALSGGGTRGFAHLGALKVLEQYSFKPDIIAGTSAGALAGVFYADGFHPDEISDLFRKREFKEFAEFTIPRKGFFKNNGLRKFLKKNLRSQSFEQLQIPLIVVATNWNTAQYETFSEGDNLIESVVASCSIPIIFSPQYINDVPYVDGGVLKNFPASVIRKQCKYVVGVNVSLMIPPFEKNNIMRVVERTFNLMTNSNALIDRNYCDILIETKGVEKYTMFNLNNMDNITEIGYLSALDKMREEDSWHVVRRCHRHNQLKEKISKRIKSIKR